MVSGENQLLQAVLCSPQVLLTTKKIDVIFKTLGRQRG